MTPSGELEMAVGFATYNAHSVKRCMTKGRCGSAVLDG
jgi:hypothetical protein